MNSNRLFSHRILIVLLLTIVSGVIVGCGPSDHLSGLVPVSGIVKYNGNPVEGASILFIPSSTASNQRTASATSKVNGEFVMMTLQPEDGVFPGEYKVVVKKEVPNKVYSQEELDAMASRSMGIAPPTYTNQLPEKYGKPETTLLNVTLTQKGDNSIVLELTD